MECHMCSVTRAQRHSGRGLCVAGLVQFCAPAGALIRKPCQDLGDGMLYSLPSSRRNRLIICIGSQRILELGARGGEKRFV